MLPAEQQAVSKQLQQRCDNQDLDGFFVILSTVIADFLATTTFKHLEDVCAASLILKSDERQQLQPVFGTVLEAVAILAATGSRTNFQALIEYLEASADYQHLRQFRRFADSTKCQLPATLLRFLFQSATPELQLHVFKLLEVYDFRSAGMIFLQAAADFGVYSSYQFFQALHAQAPVLTATTASDEAYSFCLYSATVKNNIRLVSAQLLTSILSQAFGFQEAQLGAGTSDVYDIWRDTLAASTRVANFRPFSETLPLLTQLDKLQVSEDDRGHYCGDETCRQLGRLFGAALSMDQLEAVVQQCSARRQRHRKL